MKKKLRVIIITMVLLLAGTGAFLWKMNDISKKIEAEEEALLTEERDLLEDQSFKAIRDVSSVDIIPLYLSGSEKNVVTTDFENVAERYSVKKSAEVEDNLTTIKKNRSFSLQNPLWAYNPYGTNEDSMYVYFKTSGNCYCRYTISVEDETIPDFTRTGELKTSGKVSKEHEYQIIGLVPGELNYITIKLYNKKDELSQVQVFTVQIPSSRSGAAKRIKTLDGRSKTTISNGLYVVFQDGRADSSAKNENTAGKSTRNSRNSRNKKNSKNSKNSKKKNKNTGSKKYAILLYDNSGILRGEIPTDGYIGRNYEQVYDTLLFAADRTHIVQVNALGQVVKNLALNGYRQSGELSYDDGGNIYAVAMADKKKATPDSKVIKVELETGKITEMADMDTLFAKVYKDAAKKAKKKNVDWVGINSVKPVGTNELLISAKKLSSIIKLSSAGSLLPKIDYIIADRKIYKKYKSLYKKVLAKASEEEPAEPEETQRTNILKKPVVKDPFESQYGQEAIAYRAGAEGQYELAMLSANVGNGVKSDGSSYYVRFTVDETAMTYDQKGRQAFDQTKQDGNIIPTQNGYIYCCSDSGSFMETDNTGKLIKQFSTEQRPYRVQKSDFKGFWFQ